MFALAALLTERLAVSLFEAVAPVAKGPSLTPSPFPRATPASAPLAPLAPLPLAVENGLPMPPLVAPTSAGARLAELMGSLPAEPNPWATEVRQHEVEMPSPLVARTLANPDDYGSTQVLLLSGGGPGTPHQGATLRARVPNTASPDSGDGATLVVLAPNAVSTDVDEGETLVAAVRPPAVPPINRLAAVLAAHEPPMNVPDGTLGAASPGIARPLVNAAHVSPVAPVSQPSPATSKKRGLALIAIVVVLLGALAGYWAVRS